MIEPGFTGLVVSGYPISLESSLIGLIIALTALVWTIVQHLQHKKHDRETAWIKPAVHNILKRPDAYFTQKTPPSNE